MTGRKPITYALALTLDDGVNSDVVRLYTHFANDTGTAYVFRQRDLQVMDGEPLPATAGLIPGLAVRYLIGHVSHFRNIR